MKKLINKALDAMPYVSRMHAQLRENGAYPAGHYYSPIPARSDVAKILERPRSNAALLDIDLRRNEQRALLEAYSAYYPQVPFPDTRTPSFRYHFGQSWFCHADAIFLHAFLRHFRPGRIIEIGSGFSSAAMLDTLEHFPYGDVDLTFIEPNPERLMSTLKRGDESKVAIVQKNVQDVDLDHFRSLGPGDLLFVDSSHVMKFGSDLQRIFFHILPILPAGVFVHFHDIFFPFEYPDEWLSEGRYWNENYFLRAFLSSNEAWQIVFFNHYVGLEFREFLLERMPRCLKNTGGSIYLTKK